MPANAGSLTAAANSTAVCEALRVNPRRSSSRNNSAYIRDASCGFARVASGGELARVMLAIRTASAEADRLPTLVFDEVDAGIGGEAAVQVGLRLKRLGAVRQVASPLRLGDEPPVRRGPFRGEHTEQVLVEVCGYSRERVRELAAAGVFGPN